MNDFDLKMREQGEWATQAIDLQTLFVSVTMRCNQSCAHCHVSCSPSRAESMSPEVMAKVVEVASLIRPAIIDITGGAPELNDDLPDFLRALRADGHAVQVRTNLTALADPERQGLAELYAELRVGILASVPGFTESDVDSVRGPNVRDTSVQMLRALNRLGYGAPGGLQLDLAYNPVGTALPEAQECVEATFRRELRERFGIEFTNLLVITNMPVGRFDEQLIADGEHDSYMHVLREAFNPEAVPLLPCRHQIEIGWDGRLWDCDFNLGADIPVTAGLPSTVWDFNSEALARRTLAFGEHCFACTAGTGSG